jgi:SAM-dependent methyltransferase
MDLTKYSKKLVDLPCDLCKSNDYEVLSYEQRFATKIPVVICRNCGLIYLNPRWTIEAYQEFYKKEYRDVIGDESLPLKELELLQRIHGSKILSFCNDFVKTGDKVLDIGCAYGGILYIFQKSKDCVVYGIEPNIEHANYVRNNLKIDIETNYFENSEYPKESFDLIILTQTLNHLYNPVVCLERIREILKPDGKLFIEVQNYPEMVKRGWNPTQVDHIYYFTPETLECMVRKVGFEPLNIEVDTKRSHEDVSDYMKKRTAHIHIRMLLSKSTPENDLIYPDYRQMCTEFEYYLIKKNNMLKDIFLKIKSLGVK